MALESTRHSDEYSNFGDILCYWPDPESENIPWKVCEQEDCNKISS